MRAVVSDNPAQQAAERVRELISQPVDRISLGLAGGSTPAAMYELLREMSIDWSRVDCWLSDERWVPWDDERSNGKMAVECLIDAVGGSILRPEWSPKVEPSSSALEYESRLLGLFHGKRPDLVLLGMGADGHTASLFPGSTALDELERWYVSNAVPESGEERLTATYPLLWSARHLLVLATGEAKAEAVRNSFAGSTPAGRIAEGKAEIEWHLDRDAASLLP